MEPHIAVLVLDTPIKGLYDEFGGFGDLTKNLLKDSKVPLVTYQIAYDLAFPEKLAEAESNLAKVKEYIDSGVVKGLALTGSKEDAFNTEIPWIQLLDGFIQYLISNKADFPIVGICFGHQILAKNLGCKVNRNTAENGWECGTTTIALNSSIFSVEGSPFVDALKTEEGPMLDHINLVEYHRDVVYGLPPTASSSNSLVSKTVFQSIGSTNKCSIQGFVTESGPIKILTFQGHPEFPSAFTQGLLKLHLEEGVLDKATFDRSSYKTENLINQGPVMGNVILKFFEINS